MGIFGDILGGIEDIARGPIGEAAFGLAGQAIAARFAPSVRGIPPGGGFRVPTGPGPPSQIVTAGGGPFRGFPEFPPAAFSEGGGPPMGFMTAGIVQAPQPVPFGFDPACPSFFKPPSATSRPIRFITATNPATGALTFWEHAGQPVMFSRDLAVCKRVRRIAARAGTVARRRTSRRKR